jgi:hypothetical protein
MKQKPCAECKVVFVGHVVREGVVFYVYKCQVCGKKKEVKIGNRLPKKKIKLGMR